MRSKVRSPKPAQPSHNFHPRNRHRGHYDFASLVQCCPELKPFVKTKPCGEPTIDFTDPAAVKLLNRALLISSYDIRGWDIPAGYLCPPIPGRADYLHVMADLLAAGNGGVPPSGPSVSVLDIGTGANCVYPLIGHAEYGWRFVGSDIDPQAIANARRIIAANPGMSADIEFRRQSEPRHIFQNVIKSGECFDLTLCNPPFHASAAAAAAGSRRKWQNLGKGNLAKDKPTLNFGGHSAELWCPGGEEGFITRMITESSRIPRQCLWFSSLVSKSASLPRIVQELKRAGVRQSTTLNMSQGQKQSRAIVWTFFSQEEQIAWRADPAARQAMLNQTI
jgi:23S rRNA (adenine1618-N6)-methyltransferase